MDRIKSIAVPVTRRNAIARARQANHAAAESSDAQMDGGIFREPARPPRPATARAMHRYRIGQRLVMARGSRDIARPSAICQITALVPHETGPLLYRVRSDSENFERIVDEVDLAPVR